MLVTPSWFELLRVLPLSAALSRERKAKSRRSRGHPQPRACGQLYAGDKSALARTAHHPAGRPFKIVGVMAPEFTFIDPDVRLWMPLAFTAEQKPFITATTGITSDA